MDPDAALAELRERAAEIAGDGLEADLVGMRVRMAELFRALDGWLAGGGFLPAAWTPPGRER
jgi:hypothetical protein